jgi:uncharacterized protein YggU (UPF0235/DUF167 family)
VRPGASRDQLAGEHDGAVVVRLTATPTDGKANRALRRLIADRCGVPPSAVSILRGERARRKLVAVEGFEVRQLRSVLLG